MQGTTNAAMKRNSFGDESEMELVHWSVSFFNNHKYTCGALSRHMHVECVYDTDGLKSETEIHGN